MIYGHNSAVKKRKQETRWHVSWRHILATQVMCNQAHRHKSKTKWWGCPTLVVLLLVLSGAVTLQPNSIWPEVALMRPITKTACMLTPTSRKKKPLKCHWTHLCVVSCSPSGFVDENDMQNSEFVTRSQMYRCFSKCTKCSLELKTAARPVVSSSLVEWLKALSTHWHLAFSIQEIGASASPSLIPPNIVLVLWIA